MRQAIGIVVVLVVAGALLWFGWSALRGNRGGPAAPGRLQPARSGAAITVRGYLGGEKVGFVNDHQVQRLLADRYGIVIDARKAGSTEMIGLDHKEMDFLWPSSSISQELYEKQFGKPRRAKRIFNSPLVLYSWDEVTAGLTRQGLVAQAGGGWYECDLQALIAQVDSGTKWADAGLPQLFGKLSLSSTDPNKSNSGALFCGLLANLYNGGDVVDAAALPAVQPQVNAYFKRLGYMEASSGDFFQQFLETGMGAQPLIVLYENQLVEYALEHPAQLELLKSKVRVIYPRPTVWAVHPLIALTENGDRLIEALQDPQLQKLAWERHGFRSGLAGVDNDPKVLQVAGIPAQISSVMPLPGAGVMERLLQGLAGP